MKRKELEQFNTMLDFKCQDLQKECNLLKGLISIMLRNNEQSTLMFKLSTPDPLHIKIENEMCVITRGNTDATSEWNEKENGQQKHYKID